jgi:flagellar biosynthesis protein FlhF
MEQPNSSMKIKSYFASSVEQAIQEARQELGTDAMLITSRRSSPETRSLGAYEVVFGLNNTATARPRPAIPSADLSNELQNLRAQLQDIKTTLQGTRPSSQSAEAEELFEELVSNDLARDIAQETVSTAVRVREQLSREQPNPPLPLRAYAEEAISTKLRFAAPWQPSSNKTAPDAAPVAIFAGPAGAGKTTTLIKIAIREYLAHRRPVRILSMDPYRVAAHEKLRSYAALIGVGFTAIDSVPEFLGVAEESRSKSAVLVDTPGYGPAELDGSKEIAACLQRLANKQIHLVLPASMKREDLARRIREYAAFQPDYLLFTKLDETEPYRALLSAALEADRPLSFLANGQNIPEDIEPAQAGVLLASLFRKTLAEAVTAA